MDSATRSRAAELELWLDEPAPGEANMQRDAELLAACAHGDLARGLRLYGFSPPCLSLGRIQPLADVDIDACRRDGVDVVRRPSGGRAVLHDREVTYALVCRLSDPVFGGGVLEACARIHAAVADGLARLGVATSAQARDRDVRRAARAAATASPDCFAVPGAHELLDARGRKVVGSAQARHGQALLQHGSVLLHAPDASPYLKRSVAPAAAGASDILGREVSRAELVAALAAGFSAGA